MTDDKTIKVHHLLCHRDGPVSFSGLASIANSKSSSKFKNADEQIMA